MLALQGSSQAWRRHRSCHHNQFGPAILFPTRKPSKSFCPIHRRSLGIQSFATIDTHTTEDAPECLAPVCELGKPDALFVHRLLCECPLFNLVSVVPIAEASLTKRLGRTLALFDLDHFANIANTLALVRLRLPGRTHVGSKLPYRLLIAPRDIDVSVIRANDRHSRRNR